MDQIAVLLFSAHHKHAFPAIKSPVEILGFLILNPKSQAIKYH
jgi:hypothetical protein